jgi:transposase
MEKNDFRTLTPSAQEIIRKRAVQAVLNGQSQKMAAQTFGVSEQTMTKWMALHREHGSKALAAKPRGRPKGGGRLEPWQCAHTAKTVIDHLPEQAKLPGFWLWTRNAVRELIRRRYGVDYSISTVGRLLRRWNMTPQKPARRALEQNPVEVRRWLDEEYPAIQRLAQKEKAEILWGDECGFRSDHPCGTTYGRRGQTPVVPRPGQRFGCNMISAVSNRGRLFFRVFTGKFTSRVFLDFLSRLIRQADRKVFVIVDNLSAHKSKAVKKWLSKHEKRIRLFYLPRYSPELNPDEYLNNDVKNNACGRRLARDREDMVADIRGYLRSTQRQPTIVKSLFNAKPVRYAAS